MTTTPTTPIQPVQPPAPIPQPPPISQPAPQPAPGPVGPGAEDTRPYRPAGERASGGGAAARHPAFRYENIHDREAYRRYCIELARYALAGDAGSKEATGRLRRAMRKLDGYSWMAKASALRVMRRAHRRYESAERAAAKAAVKMAVARARADEILLEGAKQKKGASGAWKVGGAR